MGAAEDTKAAATAPRLELVQGYRDEDNPEVEEGAGWAVHDLASLDWALKRLGELERQMDENKDIADARIREIQARCLRLNARLESGLRFFKGVIASYAEAHRAELCSGKRKSRALPSGTVGWRKAGGGLKTVDEAALLKWAQAQPVELGFVRIKEEPCLSEIKKHAEKTGEVPDGMEVEPEREELQVRPATKAVL